MNNLQLTGSAVFSFDSEIHTLFIASQNGRYGVVEAGSWETVIPFRFHRIEALASGWAVPEAAPGQTLTPSVQEALYDGLFGVMQGVYTPEQALDNMDAALAY